MRSDIQKMKSRGFGLVEMLIVIVILGILAGMSFLAFGRSTDNTEAASIMAGLESAKGALLAYSMEHKTRNQEPLKGFESAGSAAILASIDKYMGSKVPAGSSAANYFNNLTVTSSGGVWDVGFDRFTVTSGVGKVLGKKVAASGGMYTGAASGSGTYSLWMRVK